MTIKEKKRGLFENIESTKKRNERLRENAGRSRCNDSSTTPAKFVLRPAAPPVNIITVLRYYQTRLESSEPLNIITIMFIIIHLFIYVNNIIT